MGKNKLSFLDPRNAGISGFLTFGLYIGLCVGLSDHLTKRKTTDT